MQARIRRANPTDHDPSAHYFELSIHHDGHPEWEWTIIPMEPEIDPRERILMGLCQPLTNMRTAPESLLTLTDAWMTLDQSSIQWIHQSLLEPLIHHIHFQLRQIRNYSELPGSIFSLYQALNRVRQQAIRHKLFTQPTPPSLTGRWMRNPDAMPTPAITDAQIIEAFLNYGALEIYGPAKHDLLMTLEIQRWADGIYWVNTDMSPQIGAIIPGSLLIHLDSLSSGIFITSEQSVYTPQPQPITLHPGLQQWLTDTFLWFHEPQPDPDKIEEYLLQQARELSPEQPGLPGHQYEKRIAYA